MVSLYPCHYNYPILYLWSLCSRCSRAGVMAWLNVPPAVIRERVTDPREGRCLQTAPDVGYPFDVLLQYGLSREPTERQMSLEQFRDMLVDYATVRRSGALTTSMTTTLCTVQLAVPHQAVPSAWNGLPSGTRVWLPHWIRSMSRLKTDLFLKSYP
jgi:hypothetical protein